MDLGEIVCVGVECLRQGPFKGTCEQGNKTHSSIRRETFFSSSATVNFFNSTLLNGVS
jgi:hypothetical protein